jgi:hypothetical protein
VPRSPAIWRLILLGPSLLLTLLMFFHPSPYDHVEHELIPIATWWTVLHTLQLLPFTAMGDTLWMLVAGLRGYAATSVRIAAVNFALFYDIGDAVAGIATGLPAGNAPGGDLPEPVAVTAINSIFTDPTKDVFFGIGILALAAAALWRTGSPAYPLAGHPNKRRPQAGACCTLLCAERDARRRRCGTWGG